MEEKIKNLKDSIEKINNKNFGIYFFTIDTKGNPTAGVANIYEHAKTLLDLGYNAHILHDKNDYRLKGNEEGMGVTDWLGEEYGEIPHVSIESQQLQVGPQDFVIIPEAFASIMKQTVNFPCKRVVFLQSYEYVFEMLEIGESWGNFGINEVITTSNTLKEYINSVFNNLNTEIIPVGIPSYFKNSDKPKIPTVSISVRDNRELLKIVKVFFQKYPQYRFVTFRDMSGMSRKEFAKELSKSFLGVWVDELSSFGTFPIECMKSDTPVIGKIPRMVPEWMGNLDKNGNLNLNDNGVWTANLNSIPDLIATMVGLYIEDSIPQNLIEKMEEMKLQFSEDESKGILKEVYNGIFTRRTEELETIIKREENKVTEEVTQ
tara:strand:- start:1511 stop:2635 length:1125 start_codon:yes stop_codon:yes gene_type:complete